MSRDSFSSVNEQLNKMRQEGVAFDLDKFLSPIDLPDEVLARLKWLNNPIWWSDIKNNRCHLTVFLMEIWGKNIEMLAPRTVTYTDLLLNNSMEKSIYQYR